MEVREGIKQKPRGARLTIVNMMRTGQPRNILGRASNVRDFKAAIYFFTATTGLRKGEGLNLLKSQADSSTKAAQVKTVG